MNALPDNSYINESIQDSIASINKLAQELKIPSKAEPLFWIPKHNTLVVFIKLTSKKMKINPAQFTLIGKMQLKLLKKLKKKEDRMKISFIIDSGHIILDKNYLNPINYENIAKRLLHEDAFDSQVMIIRSSVINIFLKAGVLAISRLIPGSADRFFVVKSYKRATELVLKRYDE